MRHRQEAGAIHSAGIRHQQRGVSAKQGLQAIQFLGHFAPQSSRYKFNRAKSESSGNCRPMKNSPNSAYCALTSSNRMS